MRRSREVGNSDRRSGFSRMGEPNRPPRRPDQQNGGGRSRTDYHRTRSEHDPVVMGRHGASGGPPRSPIETPRKEQQRLRRNARQRRARRKKTEASWYTVVRGRRTGIYPRWEEAKALTDGFHGQRAYAHPTRLATLECWMRFKNGVRQYDKSSTMASRGQSSLRACDYRRGRAASLQAISSRAN